jgi:predicted cupin superfamily sugar epimerase
MNPGGLSPETHTAEQVIKLLRLEPLAQEGGFFRREAEARTRGPDGRRHWSTIYFLVTSKGFSAMHRLKGDEIWCFHAGDAVESLRLHVDGRGEWVRLGLNTGAGERLQDVITPGTWQGTRLADGGRWALISCTVVPEFVWGDFELGDRVSLSASYAAFAGDIAALTREQPIDGRL